MYGTSGRWCGVHKAAWILVIAGAISWGLIGAFQYDLVAAIFGRWMWIERILYILVGAAGIAMLGVSKCCGMPHELPPSGSAQGPSRKQG